MMPPPHKALLPRQTHSCYAGLSHKRERECQTEWGQASTCTAAPARTKQYCTQRRQPNSAAGLSAHNAVTLAGPAGQVYPRLRCTATCTNPLMAQGRPWCEVDMRAVSSPTPHLPGTLPGHPHKHTPHADVGWHRWSLLHTHPLAVCQPLPTKGLHTSQQQSHWPPPATTALLWPARGLLITQQSSSYYTKW